MDITNEVLQNPGYDVPLIFPLLTDLAGHDSNYAKAENAIRTFDAFLGGIVEAMDPDRDLVLVVSDHGNLEDVQTKTHTRNPVPALLIGKGKEQTARFLQKQKDLTGIVPALKEWFRQYRPSERHFNAGEIG